MSQNPLRPTPEAQHKTPTLGDYRRRQAATKAKRDAKQADFEDPEKIAIRAARQALIDQNRERQDEASRQHRIDAAVEHFAKIQAYIDEAVAQFGDRLEHVPFLTGHVAPAVPAKARAAK